MSIRFYSQVHDPAWRDYTSWAFRELTHGRDIRWALRTLWAMLGPKAYWSQMSIEAGVGPFTACYWRGGPDRWRIGP